MLQFLTNNALPPQHYDANLVFREENKQLRSTDTRTTVQLPPAFENKRDNRRFHGTLCPFGVYSLLSFSLCVILATCVPTSDAWTQTLDVNVDGRLGSGLLGSSNSEGTEWDRLPSFVEMNTAFVFDGDTSLEYTLGAIVQVERTAAVALVPRVRLLKPVGRSTMYASVGLPWFVAPFRRLGGELGGGVCAPSHVFLGLVARNAAFAGADVLNDTTVLAFKVTLEQDYRSKGIDDRAYAHDKRAVLKMYCGEDRMNLTHR